MQTIFRWLGSSVDFVHAALMLLWGVGLPLLFWHRVPSLSRAYAWFALGFIAASVVSHFALGECVLTTLSRRLWALGGGYRDEVPFVGKWPSRSRRWESLGTSRGGPHEPPIPRRGPAADSRARRAGQSAPC
jgi:hypothetical protein